MAQDYYTILTNAGLAYEAQQKAQNKPITLVAMAIGDGNGAAYNPDPAATTLRREVHRQPINSLLQDANNPTWLVAEAWLADDVGGWTIREVGIYTDTGVLYAIAKYPESIKPLLASGSGKQFYVRTIFQTSNVASVVLQVDNSVVMATRAFVVDYVRDELAKLDSKQSVRVATTANIALTGLQTIDGVALAIGDRVLVKDQAAAKDNGIYVSVGGVWARAADADTAAKLTPELAVGVEQGAVNGDSLWMLTTDAPITLGATPLVFEVSGGRPLATKAWVQGLTATVDRAGIVELATAEEAIQGDDKERAITPFALRKLVPKTAIVPASKDANSIRETGLYYMNNGLNCPVAEFYGWVRHSDVTPGEYAYQEAFTISGGGFWRRYSSQGVWQEWKAVPSQDAITALAEAVGQKEAAIQAGSANTYFAGDKTWRPAADMPIRPAKTTESGVVKLATTAQLAAGNDSEAAVTPALLKPYLDAIAADGNRWVYGVGANTWQVPEEVKSGKKKVRVRGVGGGGSGAWASTTASGNNASGGSGAGGFEIVLSLVGVASVPISVGTAGIGVGGAGNSVPGNNGGATSFGTYASASGGYGGRIDTDLNTGGSASSSVSGALLIPGGASGAAFTAPSGSGIYGGAGGGSMLGQGGSGSGSGVGGTGYGAASGGACGAGVSSKAGAAGILIIEVV